MVKIMEWWKTRRWFKLTIGVVVGAILGYLYYFFIGCRTGTCAITSSPVNSMVYGAVMGLILTFPTNGKDEK